MVAWWSSLKPGSALGAPRAALFPSLPPQPLIFVSSDDSLEWKSPALHQCWTGSNQVFFSPLFSRPTWDKSSYQPLNLHKSFSDSDLSDPLGSSESDTSDEELVFEGNGSETGSSSFAKQQIEKMWDGFSLEDYISRAKHSLPSSPACRKVHKKQKVWSPKITVPKPFQMTIREAQRKEQNVKSKSQIELENHLLKKQLEEEAECQKKFRANPVPAAVFLPLYHDIVQRNEERRRSVRERSKLKLLASQKPFKFIERERQRSETRKMLLKDVPPPENKTKAFRAKPVPKCVYSPDFSDKLKKEELYREIRIRMRAEELLRNSSVPNSRLALKETNKKKKHKSTEPKRTEHKPKIKSSIPNFELLHEKFQKRLLQQKKVKHLTVCEPFDLCTSYIPSKKGKILKDIQEDEEKLKETRWPFASPRRKPQVGQAGANSHLLGGAKSKFPKSTESTRRRQEALRWLLRDALLFIYLKSRIFLGFGLVYIWYFIWCYFLYFSICSSFPHAVNIGFNLLI